MLSRFTRPRAVIAASAVVLGTAVAPAGGTPARADVAPASVVVGISPNDTPAQIIAKAASVTPSPRLLAWQRLELTAFIHFGVNTYTARSTVPAPRTRTCSGQTSWTPTSGPARCATPGSSW